MTTYIIRRILLMFPLLLGITLIDFTIYALAPGDPVSAMISPLEVRTMKAEDLQRAREALGLNKPIPVRYALWLKETLSGNLGHSIRSGLPVTQLIGRGIGNTIMLITLALVLSTIGGLLLGVFAALRPYSALDHSLTGFAFAGISMPGFFIALLLVYIFASAARLAPCDGDIYARRALFAWRLAKAHGLAGYGADTRGDGRCAALHRALECWR